MNEIAVTSEREAVEAVREARTLRQSFEIVGARSMRNLGRATGAANTILDAERIKGIVAYDPEELITTVRPGTSIAEIDAELSANGQRLGCEPPDWGALLGTQAGLGTIGGAISVDACGPARVRYGAVRDQLLGICAVNGFGEAFKAGGKVVKNVTGFDIPKLVCGAFGTLCILTEVTVRVFPKPPCAQTLSVSYLELPEAFALMRRVWSSPLEATGLACTADAVFVRLEGEAVPLAEKVAWLNSLCLGHEVRAIDDGGAIFRGIGNGDAFASSSQELWRVMIPPAQAAKVISQIGAALWVADWAGGLLWLSTTDGARVREIARAAGGHAVLMRADAATRASTDVFEKEHPIRAQLTRSVKAAFDPLSLFNPGRMWDGV